MKYMKFIVAAVAAGLYATYAATTDGVITQQEWVGIAIAAVNALAVYFVPNKGYVRP